MIARMIIKDGVVSHLSTIIRLQGYIFPEVKEVQKSRGLDPRKKV
jgi:hypothetical protein